MQEAPPLTVGQFNLFSHCLQVSNPLAEDNSKQAKGVINTDTKKRFSEQLRDEGESFRAVFDKRRQRVGVFGNGDGE
jgi:YLP motif-containing protein 1